MGVIIQEAQQLCHQWQDTPAILGEAIRPGSPVQEYPNLLTQPRLTCRFELIFSSWLEHPVKIARQMTKSMMYRRRQSRDQQKNHAIQINLL